MDKRGTLLISILIFLIVAGFAIYLIINKGYIGDKSLVSYEEVEPEHKLEIQVDKENLSITDKESTEIKVLLDGEEISDGVSITTENNDIIKLDNNIVTAKAQGLATVKVEVEEYEWQTTAEFVVYKPIKSMKLTANNGAIRLGNERQLTLTTTPNDATRTGVQFESSDESIATVNNNGIISSKSKGTVTITVTDEFTGETTSIKQTIQ